MLSRSVFTGDTTIQNTYDIVMSKLFCPHLTLSLQCSLVDKKLRPKHKEVDKDQKKAV